MRWSGVVRRRQVKLASDLSTDNLPHFHPPGFDFFNVFSNVFLILAEFQRLDDHTLTCYHLETEDGKEKTQLVEACLGANKILKSGSGVEIWPKRMLHACLVCFHRGEGVRNARRSVLIEMMIRCLADKNKRLLGISPFLESPLALPGMAKLRWSA